MQRRIRVGVYNWSDFSSDNGFYPPDLPWQWRLCYFSNEFESACLSLAAHNLEVEKLLQWTEGLPDTFDLCFALSQDSELDLLKEAIHHNGLKVRSLIMENREGYILLQPGSKKTVLSAAGIKGPEQIFHRSSLWSPEQPGKSSAFAVMPQQKNMKLYRHWIEQWLEANQPAESELEESALEMTLWLDGKLAHPVTLSELRTLTELMGY